jgi:hypothetical protein
MRLRLPADSDSDGKCDKEGYGRRLQAPTPKLRSCPLDLSCADVSRDGVRRTGPLQSKYTYFCGTTCNTDPISIQISRLVWFVLQAQGEQRRPRLSENHTAGYPAPAPAPGPGPAPAPACNRPILGWMWPLGSREVEEGENGSKVNAIHPQSIIPRVLVRVLCVASNVQEHGVCADDGCWPSLGCGIDGRGCDGGCRDAESQICARIQRRRLSLGLQWSVC